MFIQVGPKERIAYITVGVLLLVGIGVAGYRYSTKRPATGNETSYAYRSSKPPSSSRARSRSSAAEDAEPAATSEVVVDVVGAVRNPGVYKLSARSRVQDAVHAAGGPKGDADLEAVNLAALLTDGEQVQVPSKTQEQGTVATGSENGNGESKHKTGKKALLTGTVSLNSAKIEQLEMLPGVGPATAQRILDYRSSHGSFTSIEELRDVGGIGDKKYAQIAPHVRL